MSILQQLADGFATGINNHPLTLMSLGAGIAQGGVGRGLELATAAAQAERNLQSKARLRALRDVPTMAEAGFPDVECEVWAAIFAPAGTPAGIIALLHREIADVVAVPDVKERFAAFGFQSSVSTPEEAAAILRSETDRWGKLVRTAGLKAE